MRPITNADICRLAIQRLDHESDLIYENYDDITSTGTAVRVGQSSLQLSKPEF